MNEDLAYLMQQCRASARQLTDSKVLAKVRAAAEQKGQGRIRTTRYFRQKMEAPALGGRSVSWSDIRAAALSATRATWQEDHGRWMLTGGVDGDGSPLAGIYIVISDSDDVYVWNAFTP
jgi:hypothetical protein